MTEPAIYPVPAEWAERAKIDAGRYADLYGRSLADPDINAQYATLVEHYHAMLDHYGEFTGVKMARKHIGWYTKGLHGSAEFRNKANFIDDAAQVLGEIDRFYGPILRRQAA